jgi:hypothetical protein
MSDRVRWMEHKGTRILYVDYSGLSGEEFIQVVDEFEGELLQQTPGSVATLTDVTNTVITNELRSRLKEMAERTQGRSRKAAAVGITGFKRAIAVLLRKDLYYAGSLEEAKDWLAE